MLRKCLGRSVCVESQEGHMCLLGLLNNHNGSAGGSGCWAAACGLLHDGAVWAAGVSPGAAWGSSLVMRTEHVGVFQSFRALSHVLWHAAPQSQRGNPVCLLSRGLNSQPFMLEFFTAAVCSQAMLHHTSMHRHRAHLTVGFL